MHFGRKFGNRKRGASDQMAAAVTMITLRASLDGLTAEQIVRCYGVPLPEATELLEHERQRRGQ